MRLWLITLLMSSFFIGCGIEDESANTAAVASDEPLVTLFGSSTVYPIPDSVSTGVTSSIATANAVKSVTRITVTVNIMHTHDSDLDIYLVSPSGTKRALSVGNGNDGDNYVDTVFEDNATTLILDGFAPFTGSYKPEETLSGFNGLDANGMWGLTVIDWSPGDIGTIDSWSIVIE